jgi:hypothetical protein
MRHWRGFAQVDKHRLRSGLRITSDLRSCIPRSLRSIEVTITNAFTGATMSANAQRRSRARSTHVTTRETHGNELW